MSQNGLALLCRQFRLPRRGCGLEECQDASACCPERGRFAIADGASESSFAALWAQLLVEDFVRSPGLPRDWTEGLVPLQQRWASAVGPGADGPLPWYLEQGLQRGAFSTFLGLVLQPGGQAGCLHHDDAWAWGALAVGDSCLFQVRGGALRRAFPVGRAADFGSTPWLVGSRTSPHEVPQKQALLCQDEMQPGDRLWLMTDALAQWFLGQIEAGGKPWEALEPLLHDPVADQTFVAQIDDWRVSRLLRNDDVALIGVGLE
jgi:hypothetical protein